MRYLGRLAKVAALIAVMATALPVLLIFMGAGYLAARSVSDMAFGIGIGAVSIAVWALYEEDLTEEDLFERHGFKSMVDDDAVVDLGQP